MRKLLTILLLLAAGISASAQYNISSVDRTFSPEFEKFPLHDGFDIVENDKPREGGTYLNVYGVHLEPMALESFPDFDKFVDSYPAVLSGRYADNGKYHQYYMKGDLYISCQCTEADDGILEPKYKRFYIEINNDSDHGVLFSFDETYVVGHRIVGGKQQDKYFTKYTAQSFDDYMGQSDYEEARRHAGVMGEVGRQLRSDSYNRGNGEWANLGLKVLSNLAFKNQKADSFTLHIPMDGYDFTFEWK